MFLLKEFNKIDFTNFYRKNNNTPCRIFKNILKNVYSTDTLKKYVKISEFGFEIIKDFTREFDKTNS